MSWIIYKHTNLINGKIYIGQTKQNANNRWKNGLGYTSDNHSSAFARAIKKYGWANFSHEIIENGLKTPEEANIREIYWIDYYRSYVGFKDCNGYNMTLGGDSGEHLGYPVYKIDVKSLEIVCEYTSTSEASREFGKGENNASSIRLVCEGRKRTCKGYYWCYKDKHSPNWKPKDNIQVSPVFRLDDDFIIIRRYESISDASVDGFSRGGVIQCCNRKIRKSGGYYWCYCEDYSQDWEPPNKSFNRNEKIYCFETNKTYLSAKFAHEDTNANASKILRCCKGLESGTNGLHFCFPKDKNNYILKKSNKKAPNFSEDELKILKEKYPLYGIDVKEFFPTRTERAISQEAHRLGLKYIGKNKHFKKVRCIELNIIFDSINDAYKFAKLKNGSNIGSCCGGKKKTAGGYHWEFVKDDK